jgi:uncharacterized protein YndB with AHSA1/START domain
MTRRSAAIKPVRRSTVVSWKQEAAFRRFTEDFAKWWPSSTHSIGGKLVDRIVFECRVGGLIYEQLKDGRRFQWGRITAWDPPRHVAFTWHPSKEEALAQDVDVTFRPEGDATRVVLVSTGWERLGTEAARARKAYSIGWGSILDVFAGRFSSAVLVFAVLAHGITFFLRVTGKLDGEIEKAGGRMQPVNSRGRD